MHGATDPAAARRTAPPARRPAGFTLVELMVVMLILAILVSLVVGVGAFVMDEANRKQTASIQKLVMEAIQAYYEYNHDYPPDREEGSNYQGGKSTTVLMGYLTGAEGDSESPGVVAARAKLADLPSSATEGGKGGLVDGYGRKMWYQRNGGLGGGPVLISAGADGAFDRAGVKDNIRSDAE